MSDEVTIKIEGVEEVCRRLQNIPRVLAKQCYANALGAGSVVVASEFFKNTPVGELSPDEATKALFRAAVNRVKKGDPSLAVRLYSEKLKNRKFKVTVGGNTTIKTKKVKGSHLKGSLMVDVRIDENGQGGEAGIGYGRLGYIARFLEFGHRLVGHKPNKKDLGKSVPPNPFMTKSMRTAAEPALRAMYDVILQTIDNDIGPEL